MALDMAADWVAVVGLEEDMARAEVLLTGFCGPNAFKAMNAAKIGVANDTSGSVREAVQAYLDGKLPLSDAVNVEGQW